MGARHDTAALVAASQELRAQVARHAVAPGRNECALPGIRFFRWDQPTEKASGHAYSLVLAVIVQGQKHVQVGGRTLSYDPLHYLVITGELEFTSTVRVATPAEPYLSLGIEVPPDLVVRTLTALATDEPGASASHEPGAHVTELHAPEGPAPAFISKLEAPVLETLVRLLRTVDDREERRILAPLIMEELVFRLLRTDGAAALRRGARRDPERLRIQQAMDFIRDHAEQPLTVPVIARSVAMSPSHFAHRFRDIARVSPMRYVKHVRLQRARQALLNGGARASEAAALVGYQSTSHFTRDFRSHFGLPPGEYARRFHDSLRSL